MIFDAQGILKTEKESNYIPFSTLQDNARNYPEHILEQMDSFTENYILFINSQDHKPISEELRAALVANEIDDLPEGSNLRREAERRMSPENLKETYETYPNYFLNNDRYTKFPLSRRVEGLAATE